MNLNLKRRPAGWGSWWWMLFMLGLALDNRAADYVVVVSEATLADSEWRPVAEALVPKHQATIKAYSSHVEEVLPELQARFPRYVCFVTRPIEATREFVAQVHRLTRRLDDDPYTDCFWGILTGYDAANALRIARYQEPLVVRKVAAGTELALDMVEEGVWYCELNKNKMVKKERGGTPVEVRGPDDTTEALVRSLTDYQADLFVTSGHATERDWMIGFHYRNGFFKHEHGQLYGLDTQNRKFPIQSPNPKVYLPVGNCLMGHIDRPDCMALAWMNSAGVRQMIGYTVPTWYGYMGWGCLDYFVEQPGRFTLTEAFFANQAALIHRLTTWFPDYETEPAGGPANAAAKVTLSREAKEAGVSAADARGLAFDRDVVAFYGDPAWEARMAKRDCAWEQSLTERDGIWTFDVQPKRGEHSFEPINTNGSQRGGRPIVQFLPERIGVATLLEGGELKPVITDNFILVPNPRICDPMKAYRVRFRAERVERNR